MYRVAFIILLFAAAAFFPGCHKGEGPVNADVLYGTWIKGSNAGDTIRFFKKNDKDLLAYSLSFNPALFAPTEVEFTYHDGKPRLKTTWLLPGGFFYHTEL